MIGNDDEAFWRKNYQIILFFVCTGGRFNFNDHQIIKKYVFSKNPEKIE